VTSVRRAASLLCHGIHNSIRAYYPHPRWKMTLTSIIEVVVILAVIIAAIRFLCEAGLICCIQSAIPMRLRARLPSTKFTFLSRSCATGRTSDSEHLFWVEFLSHKENTAPNPRTRMVNFERWFRLGICRAWCCGKWFCELCDDHHITTSCLKSSPVRVAHVSPVLWCADCGAATYSECRTCCGRIKQYMG